MDMAVEIKQEAVWNDEYLVETPVVTDPNNVVPIKIERDIITRLVPKIEKEVSQCEAVIEKDIDVPTPAERERPSITTENVSNAEVEEEEEDKELSPLEYYAALRMDIGGSNDEDINAVSSKTSSCIQKASWSKDKEYVNSRRFQPLFSAVDGIPANTLFQNYSKKYLYNIGGQVESSSQQGSDTSLRKEEKVLPQALISTSPTNEVCMSVCPLCDKPFTRKHHLQEHMETHSKWMGFDCKLCGKAFSLKSSLDAHNLTHSTDESHYCRVCFKIFRTALGLKRHMSVHRPRHSYRCDSCFRLFPTHLILVSHKKAHVKQRRRSRRLLSRN